MALLRRPTGRVLTGTVDTGRWDGGGSLSQGNILIGVTSWGDSCAKSGKPGLGSSQGELKRGSGMILKL
ncbi:trypsin-like serine protease [[Kitasatospora] papulosa]